MAAMRRGCGNRSHDRNAFRILLSRDERTILLAHLESIEDARGNLIAFEAERIEERDFYSTIYDFAVSLQCDSVKSELNLRSSA